MNDGVPLQFKAHIRKVSVWTMLKHFFVRPKMTSSNLELVGEIKEEQGSIVYRGFKMSRGNVLNISDKV